MTLTSEDNIHLSVSKLGSFMSGMSGLETLEMKLTSGVKLQFKRCRAGNARNEI